MKWIGYLFAALALGWAAVLAAGREPVDDEAAGTIALLLGIGFALVTTAGVREGSVRGANRRLRKNEQPKSFWTAVVIYYAVAGAMVLYGLLA